MQQQHTLLYSRACSLLITLFVCRNGIHCVFLSQIYIADGIIHLIQIVLVVVVTRHSSETAYHLLGLTLCHNLGHGDTGVEIEDIRRILGHHLTEGLICLLTLSLSR